MNKGEILIFWDEPDIKNLFIIYMMGTQFGIMEALAVEKFLLFYSNIFNKRKPMVRG